MSDVLKLDAQLRERAGKGASRAVRREGRVPAVIYGNKEAPVNIHVETRAVVKLLESGRFLKGSVDVNVDGTTYAVKVQEVQFHPVTDVPQHIDFLRK